MHDYDPDQLRLSFAERASDLAGLFVPTRPLLKHRRRDFVLKKLHYVRRFFPEFGGQTIRVGLTRVASGMAVAGGNELWFNPTHISHHTIAHEFIHLLQGKGGLPTGEKSCDLFSLARHWTLNDTAPYYVKIPPELVDKWGKIRPAHARLIFEVARHAVELRRSGKRHYIAYFEKALSNLTRSRRHALWPSPEPSYRLF